LVNCKDPFLEADRNLLCANDDKQRDTMVRVSRNEVGILKLTLQRTKDGHAMRGILKQSREINPSNPDSRASNAQISRDEIVRFGGAAFAFLGALGFLVFNLAGGAWLSDESYYMVAGQGYVQFLLSPSREQLAQHVLIYLHTPSQEVTGLVNHPFFGKSVVGMLLLLSKSQVPANLCCPPLMPAPMQLFWARLPSTLSAASAICIVCYLIFSRFGLTSAMLAGVYLLSDATFLQYSRLAMLDIYAAAFMIASVAVLISCSTLGGKRLCVSAMLAGLMLASKFAPSVLFSWLFLLGVVLRRRGLWYMIVYLAISLALFFLIDFYYFLLPPEYFLNAFLAAGRPIPGDVGISPGPLASFLAMFSWGVFYSIPHTWSLVEVALVVFALVGASFLIIKGTCDDSAIGILFLANATVGFASFSWERPLVFLAPVAAIFVSTTIARLARQYPKNRLILPIEVAAIAALLVQLGAIAPRAYFSNSLFQYDASAYVPAALQLPTPTGTGYIVLICLGIFAASLALSLLNRKNGFSIDCSRTRS
jgi:hypothetical protein